MPNTHCLPSGSLGTAELPVPNVTPVSITTITPSGGLGHGNVRGVVVLLHGMQFAAGNPYPVPIANGVGITVGLEELLTFSNDLAADGWVVIQPLYQEDQFFTYPATGVYNDVSNDSGHGSRYITSTLHSITHYLTYIGSTYPPGIPVVAFGFSEGAWKSAQWAINNPSSIIAFGCHCLPTTWDIFNPAITAAAGGLNFALINWSGFNLSATALNGVTLPGIVGFGTGDIFVGYSGTSTYTGSSINVNTLVGSQSLAVSSITGYEIGPNVLVTGLTGGTGRAVISFTGASGGNLTNCTTVSGSGTLTNGLTLLQNNTQLIIANASANIAGHSTADPHVFTTADATYYSGTWFVNIVDPLAPKTF